MSCCSSSAAPPSTFRSKAAYFLEYVRMYISEKYGVEALYKSEMRIYTTTIPAADRHVCLLQDRLYRMDVVCAAMGYYQVPMLSYDMASGKQ